MEEAEKARNTEIDHRVEENEEEEENGALSHSKPPNTSLADLNMLLVILSLFYLSTDDDCIECDEESEQIIRDQVAVTKPCISRLETKRREKHEPKLGRRSISPRFQTTIRDSRHGRKM